MVGAGGFDGNREPRGSGPRQLLRMDARNQPVRFSCFQNAMRLRQRESATLAEDVAKLGQPRLRHRGNKALDQQIDKGFRPLAKFRRNHMRAKKREHEFDRLLAL